MQSAWVAPSAAAEAGPLVLLEAAERTGTGEALAQYVVPDGQMATGSTLGAPKVCVTIKASGAIECVYAIEAGRKLFGTLVLHHWDERTGIALHALPGRFVINAEHQEHVFTLSNGVEVREAIFVLSGAPQGGRFDPPAVYYTVALHNCGPEQVRMHFASCAAISITTSKLTTTALGMRSSLGTRHPQTNTSASLPPRSNRRASP